jgi:hypothetical protein
MSLSLAGVFEGAIDRFVDALAAGATRAEDRRLFTNRCWQLWGLGAAGRFDEARALAAEVVEAAEATGIPWTIAGAMHGFGRAFADTDPEAALAAYRRGVSLARETGNRWWILTSGSELGALETRVGQPQGALNTFTELLDWTWEAGDVTFLSRLFVWLITIFEHLERYEASSSLLGFLGDRVQMVAPDVDVTDIVTRLRSHLGREVFDHYVSRGAELDIGRAVHHIQQEIRAARELLASPLDVPVAH